MFKMWLLLERAAEVPTARNRPSRRIRGQLQLRKLPQNLSNNKPLAWDEHEAISPPICCCFGMTNAVLADGTKLLFPTVL